MPAFRAAAVRHLVKHPYSGLLMDPGLGKTGCVYAAFSLLRKYGHVKRLLVVAPLNPCYLVWPAENEKWHFGFHVEVLHGSKKEKKLVSDADVLVINYDGMRWLCEQVRNGKLSLKDTWLVLDESTKVKHTRTQRFKLLKNLLPLVKRRTILTGTPAPNGLIDLFGQLYCVDLGLRLGRFITHFRNRWFYPSGYGGYTWVPQEGAEADIRRTIADVCLRFDDRELKLPRYLPNTIPVELPPKARALYDELERDFISMLSSGVVLATNAAVLTSKLRQVANGGVIDHDKTVHHLHTAKADAVGDLVEELSGNPLIVAYEFVHDRDRLLEKFGDDTPWIGGGMNRKDVIRIFSKFNDGESPVLLCQTETVSHGLNLQERCHTICWHSLTWNLESYIQLIKRVHRSGQAKRVTVHHVVAQRTIDERMMDVLGKKDKTQRQLLAGLRQHYLRS